MKWPKIIVGLAVPLGLMACDQSSTDAPARRPIEVRSAQQDQLHRLNNLDRAIALKRAIQSSNMPCKRLEASRFVTRHGSLDMWTASCDDGRQWALFVGADDSVQVRDCREMAQFKLPACGAPGQPVAVAVGQQD